MLMNKCFLDDRKTDSMQLRWCQIATCFEFTWCQTYDVALANKQKNLAKSIVVNN